MHENGTTTNIDTPCYQRNRRNYKPSKKAMSNFFLHCSYCAFGKKIWRVNENSHTIAIVEQKPRIKQIGFIFFLNCKVEVQYGMK